MQSPPFDQTSENSLDGVDVRARHIDGDALELRGAFGEEAEEAVDRRGALRRATVLCG